MSWDQDYIVPRYLDLLISLTGKQPEELLEAYLLTEHLCVMKKEEVILDEGFYEPVKGIKVTLSDGRVFVPKLVERFSENGNHGIDSYQYFPEDVTPNISHTGLDHAADDADETVEYVYEPEFTTEVTIKPNDGCGCGD